MEKINLYQKKLHIHSHKTKIFTPEYIEDVPINLYIYIFNIFKCEHLLIFVPINLLLCNEDIDVVHEREY